MIKHLCDYCGGREEPSEQTFTHTDFFFGLVDTDHIRMCKECFPGVFRDLKRVALAESKLALAEAVVSAARELVDILEDETSDQSASQYGLTKALAEYDKAAAQAGEKK